MIRQSLEGNYRSEWVFILGQNVTRYKDLQRLIGDCEKEMGRMMDAVPAAAASDQAGIETLG